MSDLLESVANSEENSFEAISSEDMIHSTKQHNRKIAEKEKRIADKERCTRCRIWRIRCKECGEDREEEDCEERREKTVREIIAELIKEMIEDAAEITKIQKKIEKLPI